MKIEEKNLEYDELALEGAGYTNARIQSGLDQKSLFEFACTLAKEGILNRLIVWEATLDGAVTHVVIAGQRRYLAAGLVKTRTKDIAKAIGGDIEPSKFKTIPCRIVQGTLAEAEAVALAENIHRKELSSYEIAAKLDVLSKRQDQKTLAGVISKSPAYVSTLLTTYRKATTALRNAWKSGKLTDELVQDIAKLDGAEAQTSALKEALEVRNGGSNGATRQAKSAARQSVKAKVGSKNGKHTASPIGRRYLKAIVKRLSLVTPTDSYVKGSLDAFDVAAGGMDLDDLTGHSAFKAHEKKVAEAEKAALAKKQARAEKKAKKAKA